MHVLCCVLLTQPGVGHSDAAPIRAHPWSNLSGHSQLKFHMRGTGLKASSLKSGAVIETIVRGRIAIKSEIAPIARLLDVVGPLEIDANRELGKIEGGER